MSSEFSIESLDASLAGTRFHGRLHHFPVIDSTNTHALAQAQHGVAAPQVYLADEQTAGRGRGGHTWHSEPERGLYLTVLVRPQLRSSGTLAVSLLAGLAAKRAVQQAAALQIDLRWPNDLVIGAGPARKLGGILTEAVSAPAGELRYAAIGIGINLNQLDFPPELAAIATSVRRETGQAASREAVAGALLRALHDEFCSIETSHTPETAAGDVLCRFAAESSWVTGKHVQVDEGDGYTGVTAGLTPDGLLQVRCDEGALRVVRHGGVREL